MAGRLAGGRARTLRALAAGVHGRRRAAVTSRCGPSRRCGWRRRLLCRRSRRWLPAAPGRCCARIAWRCQRCRHRLRRRHSSPRRRCAPLDALPTHATMLHGTVRGVEALPTGRRVTLDAVRLDGSEPPLHRKLRVRLKANDARPGRQRRPGQRARAGPARRAARLSGRLGHAARCILQSDLGGSGYALGPGQRQGARRRRARCSGCCGCARPSTGASTRCWPARPAALAQALLSGVMTGVPASRYGGLP